jgi:sterol desaturase/sphingolipid hydroxylase (fatty acid hydroxylase superfamily)
VSMDRLPSLQRIIVEWITMCLVFSTSLFILHGALHSNLLYKTVHKKHHSFHESVGFTALYAHPIEGLFGAIHVVSAILIVRPSFLGLCLFFATTVTEILDSHCGYDVPWAWVYPWSDRYPWGSGARAHDFHHSHNVGIYGGGLIGLWDRLFGTDATFREYERKRLLTTKDK